MTGLFDERDSKKIKESHNEWDKGGKPTDMESIMITRAVARDVGVHFVMCLIVLFSARSLWAYFFGSPETTIQVMASVSAIYAAVVGYGFKFLLNGGSQGLISGALITIEEITGMDLDGDGHVGAPPPSATDPVVPPVDAIEAETSPSMTSPIIPKTAKKRSLPSPLTPYGVLGVSRRLYVDGTKRDGNVWFNPDTTDVSNDKEFEKLLDLWWFDNFLEQDEDTRELFLSRHGKIMTTKFAKGNLVTVKKYYNVPIVENVEYSGED